MLQVPLGDVDPVQVRAAVERAFAGWTGGETPAAGAPADSALFRYPAPAAPTARTIYLVDKPGAAQSSFAIGLPGPARDTPDFPALQVMNGALGGMFSSRLNNNLRETRGYTYGIYSHFDYDRTPAPFSVEASVQQDATGESVREILREIAAMREQPLSSAELTG